MAPAAILEDQLFQALRLGCEGAAGCPPGRRALLLPFSIGEVRAAQAPAEQPLMRFE